MAEKKRGLGRGLDALLGANALDLASPVLPVVSAERLRILPIERLHPSQFQPRKTIDAARLQELADSISSQGIVQPMVVRETSEGKFEIIAGERRWRAAQLAGLREVPVLVRDVHDQAALAIALIENIQREDLNPLEAAVSMKRLLEEHGLTHQQLADAVGKSRATITNLLRLNELHTEVQDLLLEGRIDMGHARAILGMVYENQPILARKVADKGLSVRATELLIQEMRAGKTNKTAQISKDPDIRRMENDLSDRFGALVTIRHGKKGSGKLVIEYDSLEQLEGVLQRFE